MTQNADGTFTFTTEELNKMITEQVNAAMSKNAPAPATAEPPAVRTITEAEKAAVMAQYQMPPVAVNQSFDSWHYVKEGAAIGGGILGGGLALAGILSLFKS